jgi:hypothetical protein
VDTVILPMFPNVFSLTESTPGQVTGSYGAAPPTPWCSTTSSSCSSAPPFQTTIALSTLVSGEAQLQLGRLTDLYLAFFGRAPDVGGLEYWQENCWRRAGLCHHLQGLRLEHRGPGAVPRGRQQPGVRAHGVPQLLRREPDAGGWDYWTGRLDGLGVTDLNDRGAFVGEVILGAYAPSSGAEDRALLTNRHEAAMYYVNRLAVDPAEGFDAAINTLLDPGHGRCGHRGQGRGRDRLCLCQPRHPDRDHDGSGPAGFDLGGAPLKTTP